MIVQNYGWPTGPAKIWLWLARRPFGWPRATGPAGSTTPDTIYNTLILPHFHYCLLLWGSVVKENHSLHLLQKKALRIITNSDYLAPLCKRLRILKISDMFSVALWKFYYKLMNNKLPEHFSFMKPVLPAVTERYEIRNLSFHAPAIKHKFAECSLQ